MLSFRSLRVRLVRPLSFPRRVCQSYSPFCSKIPPLTPQVPEAPSDLTTFIKKSNPRKEEQQKYYLQNKEVIKARQGKYRSDNRESLKMWHRRYRLDNNEFIKARGKETRALRRKNNPPSTTFKSWKTAQEVRDQLDQLAQRLKIQDYTDWYRVSRQQVEEEGCGGMLRRYGRLGPALQLAYPEIDWDPALFSTRNKKAVQRWLLLKLTELLPPGTKIEEEYSHPKLQEKSGYVLDMFVPEYNLALEYQGVQHYSPQKGCFGSFDAIQKNDTHKRQLCEEAGIILVAVPYWWDKSQESLAATLNTVLPRVIDVQPDWKPIPHDPPKPHPVEIWGHEKMDGIAKIIMHGRSWNPTVTDPTGWIMTEKFDGVRGYWDGKAFYSKNGYLLNTPRELRQMLPVGVPLDGEFWLGYNKFYELVSIINRAQIQTEMSEDELQKLWEPVVYKIFDAPGHDGHYVERISWAKQCLPPATPSKISVANHQICTGTDHLTKELDAVKMKIGEGLMIYHPLELYTPGRTKAVQKVKVPLDTSQVTFQRVNAKSVAFICRQVNGVGCLVKCCLFDFQNPPPQGTLMTVQHAGYHKRSQKMKAPVLVRIE